MQLKSYLRGLGTGIFIAAVLMGIALSSGKNSMTDEEVKQRAAQLGMVEEDSVLLKKELKENDSETTEPADRDDGTKDEDAVKPDVPDDESDTPTENEKKNIAEGTNEENPDVKENDADNSDETGDTPKIDIKPGDTAKSEDRAMGGKASSQDSEDNTAGSGDTGDTSKESTEKEDTAKESSPKDNKGSSDSFTLEIASGVSSYTVAKLLQKGGVIADADDFDNYLCDNKYDNKINHGIFKIPADADYEQIALIITGKK